MSNESNIPEKMDLRSMDISAENRAKMKALFPSVFTESINEEGTLVESIDFDRSLTDSLPALHFILPFQLLTVIHV